MARCVLLVLAILPLGFAPAPFPRPPKPKPATAFGLPALQGKWKRTSLLIDGRPTDPGTGMTITGDVMSCGSASDSWRLVLSGDREPRAFSATRLDRSMAFWGVCKLEGD